jgi:hypothetical protein
VSKCYQEAQGGHIQKKTIGAENGKKGQLKPYPLREQKTLGKELRLRRIGTRTNSLDKTFDPLTWDLLPRGQGALSSVLGVKTLEAVGEAAMASGKKPGIPKIDQQLSYWKNWIIVDAVSEERLVDFASDISTEFPVNINGLIDYLRQFPENALLNPEVWRVIAFIRESEAKGGLPEKTFEKILKAMRIEKRGAHKKMKSADLERLICRDFIFFVKMLKKGKFTLEEAIDRYIISPDLLDKPYYELSQDEAVDQYYKDKQIENEDEYYEHYNGEDNYKAIYKAYNKAYKKLIIANLSQKEAIHFLEIAGRNVSQMWHYAIWTPDNRPLLYAKGGHMIKEALKKG